MDSVTCDFCHRELTVIKHADGDGGIRYYFAPGDCLAVAVRAAAPGKAPAVACRPCLLHKREMLRGTSATWRDYAERRADPS
jgi:hypothetical protein